MSNRKLFLILLAIFIFGVIVTACGCKAKYITGSRFTGVNTPEPERYFTSAQVRKALCCTGDSCGTAVEYLPRTSQYIVVYLDGRVDFINDVDVIWKD